MVPSRIFRLVNFSVFVFLAAFGHVQIADAQWTYRVATDPYIRNVFAFANTPAAGTHTLYVGTLTDGVYKVTDTGNQTTVWQKINNALPVVQARTLSAIDINTLYAGTDGAGLFKTSDANAAATWTAINGGGASALGCANIRSFNFDATMPRTLIVGTSCRNNSGLYKSIDDGATWNRLGNGVGITKLPDDVAVSSLLRDVPSNTWFLATSNYGIFKSIDAGVTWASANTNITAPNGTLNAFNVQFTSAAPMAGITPINLMAYVHGSGIYRSTDTGATWTLNNANLPAGFAAMGGIQKESNTAIYIGLDKQGVYKTIDGGLNWAPWANTANDNRTQLARTVTPVAGASTPTYYFGTIDGVGKAVDSQVNLTANTNQVNGVNYNGGGGRINAITHDRDTPYKAYVTGPTLYQIGYVYGDCSAGCSPLDTGVTGNTIEGAAYQDQTNPAVLYVTTSNRGIFKSTNSGALFSAINNGLPSMIGQSSRLAIDASNSQILYLGLSDAAGVFKSTDGGTNWLASNNGLATADARSINTVTLDPNNSAIVYAATDAGLYKSIDSGASWTLKYSATDSGGSLLPVNAARVRIGNSQELYIANNHANANGTLTTSSGIHKSTNGGDTWTKILGSQAASQVRVLANGDIYAGISANVGNPAVWLSTDGGTSFTPYSGGLNGSDIRSFGVAADSSAVMSLALENGMYTHNTAGPPPSVALSATITEAPGIFSRVFLGYQTVNTTSPGKAVTITNISATPASIVAFGFSNQDNFNIQSHDCPLAPLTLAAGASCTVNVNFTPNFGGFSTDTLLTAGPVSGVAVSLSGYGIQSGQSALAVANFPGMVPAYPTFYTQQTTREITFGNQAIGTSRTIVLTLRNFGSAVATFNFTGVSAPMSVGSTCGGSIVAGGSCQLSINYAPTAAGITNQTLNINHNSPFPIQSPSIPFLLYGIAENPATDGSLIASFGTGTSPGGAGKAFVSFGPYGTEFVDRLALQSDGKVIALMWARKAVEDGIAVAGVARLNADGTLDTTWGSAGYVRLAPAATNAFFNGTAGLYVLSSGKVIVAFASATTGAPNPDMVITRLLSDGTVDTTFGIGGSTVVANLGFMRLEIYADDRMLATGNTDPVNNNKMGLVRLNADGSLDASFGNAGRADVVVPDVIQLANTQSLIRTRFAADGKIFVMYSYGVGSARDIAVYKLTTSGAIDTSWGTGGRVNVAATNLEDNARNMRVQSDGKILLTSRTERASGSGTYQGVLVRLNPDGTPDTLFGTAGVVTTSIGPSTNFFGPLQVMADGKILVAGRRNCGGSCLSGTDSVIIRYNPDGTLDTSFGTGGILAIVITVNFENINDMQLMGDGTIVAGGQVSQFDVDRGSGPTSGSVVDNGFVVKVKNTVGAALLNLTVTVTGSGSVTSSPLGINCGNVCVASFAPATMVTLTAATSGGSVFAGWSGGGCAGTGACVVTLTMATNVTATFTGGVAMLVAVQSRKVHAGVTYDLPITIGVPINGAITVEPRLIGAGHKIVFQFDQTIAAMLPGSVTTTAGTATATASGNQEVIVTLTGVADNQRATISLSNVNGNGTTGTVSMGFLVGDVSSSQRVNASDISAVKARAAGVVTPQNFKYDLNASGAINSQDMSLVKARSGLSIP